MITIPRMNSGRNYQSTPQNWGMYTIGYKEAGDLLLQYALNVGRQNVLVYPIIFLYRHYIELQLKEIITKRLGIFRHSRKLSGPS